MSPPTGLYRLTSPNLLQSTYSLRSLKTGHEPIPISEADFFKTVAELEKDYTRRSVKPTPATPNSPQRHTRQPLGETQTSGNVQPKDTNPETDPGDDDRPSLSHD